jgi:hypothetical protein
MMYFAKGIVLCLSVTSISLATTMNLRHNGYGAKDSMELTLNGNTVSSYAGVYMLDKSNASGPEAGLWPDGTRTIASFCMDLKQHSSSQSTTYTVLPVESGPVPFGPMGTAKADYLRELWGRYFDPSWVGNGPFTYQQNQAAEAFEICVWEIIYEDLPSFPTLWDVTTGKLDVKSSTVDYSLANTWLHNLDGTGPKANLRCLSSESKQDFLAAVSVPEPVTIVLTLLGLPIYAIRRRSVKM